MTGTAGEGEDVIQDCWALTGHGGCLDMRDGSTGRARGDGDYLHRGF